MSKLYEIKFAFEPTTRSEGFYQCKILRGERGWKPYKIFIPSKHIALIDHALPGDSVAVNFTFYRCRDGELLLSVSNWLEEGWFWRSLQEETEL